MTITATPSEIAYAGNGVTVAFEIPFVFDTSADIKVITTDSDGEPTEITTGFAITGGAGDTGTCTFDDAPAAGVTITILDDPDLTQDADYEENDAFAEESHERALDRSTRQIKRLHQRVGRTLRVADGDPRAGDDLLLPLTALRAGKYLAFDGDGKPTASSGTGADAGLREDLADGEGAGSALVALRITQAEIDSGVTISNWLANPYTGLRYGVTGDGVTDDRLAVQRAFEVMDAGGEMPRITGRCRIAKTSGQVYGLLFGGDLVWDGNHQLELIKDDDSYNLIKVIGGTNIRLVLKNMRWNGGRASIVSAASEDILCRIESSIDTIEISGIDGYNYCGDMFYFRADVNGAGGWIKYCRATNGGRSAFTIARGEKLVIENFTTMGIRLQPFTVAPTSNTTVLRHIRFINCFVYGGGDEDGVTYATTDRCGIFILLYVDADHTVQGDIEVHGGGVFDFGVDAPVTVPFAFGVEVRANYGVRVIGLRAEGCRDAGLYAYLTDGTVYEKCFSIRNGKGLWMNDCTRFTDDVVCFDNVDADYDYEGPDGATTFLRSEGQNRTIGRGVVTYTTGTPALDSKFNVTISDAGVGRALLTFVKKASSANYSVKPTLRGEGTGKEIEVDQKTDEQFEIRTYSGGSLSDENFEFHVVGCFENTTEPA